MSMLCSCGTAAGDAPKPDEVINETADADVASEEEKSADAASADIVGIYHYQEEAMGGQLTVDWTLELKRIQT